MADNEVQSEPQGELSPAAAIVAAAMDDNAIGVVDAFNAGIQARLQSIVQDRKIEVASNLLLTPVEQTDEGTSDDGDNSPSNSEQTSDDDEVDDTTTDSTDSDAKEE